MLWCPRLDFTTQSRSEGTQSTAIAGGSATEVVLLVLDIKLCSVVELFILSRLYNEGNVVILTVG